MGVGSGPPAALQCENREQTHAWQLLRDRARWHLEMIRLNPCHFIDGETKAPQSAGTCSRPLSTKVAELGLTLGLSPSYSVSLSPGP